MQIDQIQTEKRSTNQAQPRKLVLNKETLRQLTTKELRLVAGGVDGGVKDGPAAAGRA
jgi:hypothetical protein